MRKPLTLLVLIASATAAYGQPPPPAPDRFGVAENLEAYPQDTPKAALASAIKAIDRGRYDYFTAFLLDPALVNAKVAQRSRSQEDAAERDLRALRDRQRGATPGVDRVPLDPPGFEAAVLTEARLRAFRLVAQDVRALLTEQPDHLRELQRFLRAAEFTESGDDAKATLPDVKDRQVFFKRNGVRWNILDRKQEPPVPTDKN